MMSASRSSRGKRRRVLPRIAQRRIAVTTLVIIFTAVAVLVEA
jgi:hypothetical protein